MIVKLSITQIYDLTTLKCQSQLQQGVSLNSGFCFVVCCCFFFVVFFCLFFFFSEKKGLTFHVKHDSHERSSLILSEKL